MPYIKKEGRDAIVLGIPGKRMIYIDNIETVGELNYAFTEIMIEWLKKNGTSYTQVNALVGALECAKLELYRRVAAPYEDIKIKENGDVY